MTPTTLCAFALALLPVRDTQHSATVCLDVATTSIRAGVDPALAVAIAWGESRLRDDVVSPVGAVGPLQVVRRYWCAPGWGDTECGLWAHAELVERHGLRGGICRYKRWVRGGVNCREAQLENWL
jgi:hypothetical protein